MKWAARLRGRSTTTTTIRDGERGGLVAQRSGQVLAPRRTGDAATRLRPQVGAEREGERGVPVTSLTKRPVKDTGGSRYAAVLCGPVFDSHTHRPVPTHWQDPLNCGGGICRDKVGLELQFTPDIPLFSLLVALRKCCRASSLSSWPLRPPPRAEWRCPVRGVPQDYQLHSSRN